MTTTVLNNTRALWRTELISNRLSLQTFFVLLSGALLGRKYGALSQAVYLGLGAAGIGVFAGGAGLAYLLGPTGGYIAGFVLASFLTGWMIRSKENAGTAWIFLSMLSGAAVILITGALWLVPLLHISPAQAFTIGILPFIPGDLVKLSLAALVFHSLQTRARKIFP